MTCPGIRNRSVQIVDMDVEIILRVPYINGFPPNLLARPQQGWLSQVSGDLDPAGLV